MKKYGLIILMALLLTGCENDKAGDDFSKLEKITTINTTEATTEAATEMTTEASLDSDIPEEISQYINDYTETDFQGTYTIIAEINSAGHMAEVADYVTQKAAETNYSDFDIMVSYIDPTGWVCTWHSYDAKTGILINTLTDYTELDVTVDRLYEWNNSSF